MTAQPGTPTPSPRHPSDPDQAVAVETKNLLAKMTGGV